MKKIKRIMGWVMTFLFLMNLVPQLYLIAKAAVLTGPIVNGSSVTFNYQGDGTEVKVIVKGSWNSWTPVEMTKGDNDLWSASLTIPKGLYEYGICTWSADDTSVNGQWKADPSNPIKANDGNPVLVMGPVANAADGTVTFYYVGSGDEQRVIVKGSWSSTWSVTDMTKNTNITNLWEYTMTLTPGTYEYGICTWTSGDTSVNGQWKADPMNPNPNGGNPNVTLAHPFISTTVNDNRTVTFRYKGDSSTTSVNVVGMNDWNSSKYSMTKGADDIWSVTTDVLTPGKYEYKLLVNGSSTLIVDPANVNRSSAGNSLVYVPGFYSIGVSNVNYFGEVLQQSTGNLTAVGLKADGKDETISSVNWSISPSNAASITNGVLTINALETGVDKKDITITGIKDGVTVTKTISIVRSLSEQPGGKTVVLVGDLQSEAGGIDWTPSSMATRMIYQGNGLYKLTLKNFPGGSYAYKVALHGSWGENYGANGIKDGANIPLQVPTSGDITFYYSDNSHLIVDSTFYVMPKPILTGTGIPANTVLQDINLKGVCSAKLTLPKGTYDDLVIADGDRIENLDTIEITEESKTFTINYDSVTGIIFNNLGGSGQVDTESLYYDSKDTEYKSVYGAVPARSSVSFKLQAKKDNLTAAKLVVLSGANAQVIDMHKDDDYESDVYDKWTADYTPDKIGVYRYYFVVMDNSDVKVYCDDDGYYGTGRVTDFGSVVMYDLTVYDPNYKTPDWFKNAVVYQIFPDRFFNGDTTNDYAALFSRGNTPYEFISEWYSIPENPTVEFTTDENGNQVLNPDYRGNVGDGIWNNDVYGGDLKGIEAKLQYLKSLGVNTLYLNPIANSSSNHKYDTKKYSEIDPMLGTMDDYMNLAKAANELGMHLILDGVFNHVSDDSIYFDRYGKYVAAGKPIGAYQYWSRVYDLMNANIGMNKAEAETEVQAILTKQGITDFRYKDWFIVNNTKNADGVYQYSGWYGQESLPEIQALNGSEYNVSSYANEIIDGPNAISVQWLKAGADGWRLDAAETVSDDTWRKFRTAVKEYNQDAIIIGEYWLDSSKYLVGDIWDSVMNYRFRTALQGYVTGTVTAVAAMNDLEKIREQYPKEAFEAMMNIIDSHDTVRILTQLDGDTSTIALKPSAEALAKMKLVPFIQMTYPGAPTIYYGDELGTVGSSDPDCRRAMAWGKGNQDLVEWYAKLANIRNAYPVLRTGDILPLTVSNNTYANDVLAYIRKDSSNHAVVVANRSTSAINGLVLNVPSIPDGTILTNVLANSQTYTVQNGSITVDIPAQSGIILVVNYKTVTVDKAGLKDAYDPSFVVSNRVRVAGVTIEPSLSLNVGLSRNLAVEITPDNATLKNVTWKSSDIRVATVDDNGTVTAVGEGTATVTATTVDGGFKAICTITVINNNSGNSNIGGGTKLVSSITVSAVNNIAKITTKNGKLLLSAVVNPADASNKSIEWTVSTIDGSATTVATISNTGLLTAIADGTVKVTAAAKDGSGVKGSIEVAITGQSTIVTPTVPSYTEIRIGGANRYETSVKVSQRGWITSDYAVLARGDEFADALCAAPFAKRLNAPILLTSTKFMDSKVTAELKRLKVKKVYIIGGTGAVSEDVENALKSMRIDTERISGSDRYATSLAIANKMNNKSQVFLTTGSDFADAVSIASYAAATASPIILTAKDQITSSVAKFISDNKSKVYAIGDSGVISDSIVRNISGAERVGGTDRYKTNLAILNKFAEGFDYSNIYLTTGANYPDAICGAAIAGKEMAPIVLVNNSNASDQKTYINSVISKVKNIIVLGGEGATSSSSVNNIIK
ncbi:cell wall-binding repeat-containing protein [Clostridium thermarum]|uniref:cell wall-binding repeat-containing protein n=1 Tax=Clostridium thermarum TaxID=1716543 RepID=UPI0013D1D350|nr:cell wall-binding repeat-containing protein [Clostridium thermarum]